ncbi:hypothetical protein OUZ56_014755 [Daphnia magna]|uniref:Uncharacterized protein n=1 Tax=Daphnia magna TaxID=35525 RepID=A0ABR0AKY1_9CRUS|nr:hypothetical protein OUZ56_014755 [Daphnia magna]
MYNVCLRKTTKKLTARYEDGIKAAMTRGWVMELFQFSYCASLNAVHAKNRPPTRWQAFSKT